MTFDPDAAAAADSGIFGLPHSPSDAGVVLVPVAWDATTSYRPGTSRGPAAIFEASRQVELYDLDYGRPYQAGIAMLPEAEQVWGWNAEARRGAEPIIVAAGRTEGDARLTAALERVNQLSEQLNDWVAGTAEHWLDRGKLVGVVGGDHSVSFGAIAALAARNPGMGILHVDAHADLRLAFEGFTWSHASIMYNAMTRVPGLGRLVQVGIRDLGEAEHEFIAESDGAIVTFFDSELANGRYLGASWGQQVARIIEPLPERVYISFDIDGLDPSLCPHTGTPVPGGLGFHEACYLLYALASSGRRIVGFDLNEVAPGPEGDGWDGNVGARLLYKLIGATLATQR